MFGVSRTKVSRPTAKKMDSIAKKHGAYLVEADLPGTGYQRWFATRNLGHPFDGNTAHSVLEECLFAGLLPDE